LQTKVQPPRPRVSLLSKSIQPGASASGIRLGDQDLLPQDGKITFFVKSELPEKFARDEKIEVASEDESFRATLGVAEGNLGMQEAAPGMAGLGAGEACGPSAVVP